MKILFVVDSFPKLSETFIVNQITELIDLGHEVDIFARDNPNEKSKHEEVLKYKLIDNVSYLNMPNNIFPRLFQGLFIAIKNLIKDYRTTLASINTYKYGIDSLSLRLLFTINILNKKEYDIVHCHFGPNGILGMFLKDIKHAKACIVSFHGYDANMIDVFTKLRYKYLFNYDCLFTVNSDFTKKQIMHLGCEESRIVIIPAPLNIKRFMFKIRNLYENQKIIFLTIGRLIEKKGHEYSIKAIAKIYEHYKNIEYIIVGSGPMENELKSLTKNLGLDNVIKFTGALNHDDISDLYNIAHIFILSAVTAKNGDKEGQALVLQEAQAVGLPVVSTFHNGIPEGVLNGKSGYLVAERDVNALVEKLKYLIDHKELWPTLGKNGREFVKDKYDMSILSKKLENIYKKQLLVN